MFNKIAVAYEEQPESIRALQRGFELAKVLKLPLTVLMIAEPLPAYTAYSVAVDPSAIRALEDDKAAFYETLREKLIATGVREEVAVSVHILEGNTVRTIVDFVHEHAVDLLIVGLHRRSLRIASLWSTVYSLAQELSSSVLGVH